MSGLFKAYKTDASKEVSGVRIEFAEAQNDDGTIPTFILSRLGKSNTAYTKAMEAETRPYRRQMELGTMKNEVAEELFKKVFVNTVLKGWENVQDEDGKEIPFSPANALNLINAPGMGDFYERLQTEANLSANFRELAREAEAKN